MQQTSDSRYRLRARTFTCMGTVISVTVPSDAQKAPGTAEDELEAATAVVERLFTELDGTFSLYRPDSEASRLARGELVLQDASAEMRARYEEAAGWRLLTEGAFTPDRPDGALNCPGSSRGMRSRKRAPRSRPGAAPGAVAPARWRPTAAGKPRWRRPVPRNAATTSERRRRRRGVQAGFRGRADVVTADVLATAIVARGMPMLRRGRAWDIEVLAVRRGGELLATPDSGGRSRRGATSEGQGRPVRGRLRAG